ncbi:hypothetical protein GCM10010975_00320 [Comamonas phosphati]|nr:hypothetical protein GCM10010975_00320 [Comamonas phosphati]
MQQIVLVGSLQHLCQGVAFALAAQTLGCGKQMQVVIAEQGPHGIARRHAGAQDLRRLGAAIYQVAENVKRVPARAEIHGVQ